jgi:predicted dehydrogenase
MSKDFRWGIIGTGGIARTFARDLAFAPGHSVAAVGSREFAKAEVFAEEFSAAPCGSYQELVQQELDGVYVATPHPMHAPNTILALENGKPVLCEKPFAVNSRESAAMIETARQNNLLLVEAMWSRFLPTYRKIRELLHDEVFGDILSVAADHGQHLPLPRHYRLHAPKLAGGALLDLGIYPISFAYMVLGKPSSIVARGEFTPSGVDSQTSMIFQYAHGAHAQLTTTLLLKSPCTAQIIGSEASLFIDGDFYTPTLMRLKKISGEVIDFPRVYQGHGLREQAIEFAKLISEGKKESDLMTHADSQSIMETMDEIRSQIGLRYPFEN